MQYENKHDLAFPDFIPGKRTQSQPLICLNSYGISNTHVLQIHLYSQENGGHNILKTSKQFRKCK